MKTLKESFTRRTKRTFPLLLSIRSVVLSLCVLLPALETQAQTEKQISYPVAVPIERAAVSSAPSVPAVKAPTPIIRSLDDATTPPVRAKTPAKKTTSTAPATKATKTTVAKKPTTTSTTKTTQKPLVKVTPKTPAKNINATVAKKPAPKLVTIPSVAAAGVSAEEEQELAQSLADEGDDFAGPDIPESVASKTTASTIVTIPANALTKIPLPMSNQREAFVTEFKNFVETKLVPKAPGLALAIIADGKVKVLQAYGLKKVGTNSLVNADTTFRLASVSKSFGATAAAMMVNEGLIRWDTKVTDVLPEVEFSNPRYGDQLTIQHILSQSTGLPTQTNSNFIEEGLPFDEVVRRLRYVNFVCPPGKCYNYQNVTYSLISNIVLKKTGMTYEQFLENKLFRPLGMRTATVGFAGYSINGNYAVPHLPTRKGWVPTTVTEHYYRVNPAAGVNASITDMSRWVLAHMGQNPTVLPPAVLNAVHAKITRNTPAQNHYGSREGVTDSHYGLGWRVFDYRGDKNFVHHGGGVKGFRSEVVFSPELKIGMVILTNGPRLSGGVIFDFLDAYEDEKRGERKKEAAAPVKKKKK